MFIKGASCMFWVFKTQYSEGFMKYSIASLGLALLWVSHI